MKKGTILNSTIITTPSYFKILEKTRTLEAHQTKKECKWHFSYYAHIGVDITNDLEHHLETTTANVHAVMLSGNLLNDEEDSAHGDSVFLSDVQREDALACNKRGKRVKTVVSRGSVYNKHNTARSMGKSEKHELGESSLRSKLEDVFGMVKGTFGYRKTRYKGRRRQGEELNVVLALANLYLADKRISLTAYFVLPSRRNSRCLYVIYPQISSHLFFLLYMRCFHNFSS